MFAKQTSVPGNDLHPSLFCKNLHFSQFITNIPFSYVRRLNNLESYMYEQMYRKRLGGYLCFKSLRNWTWHLGTRSKES